MRRFPLPLLAPLALAVLASGCGKPKPTANAGLDALDGALINGMRRDDNMLDGAIKVDPRKLHARVDRPATTSLAEVAQRQAAHLPALPQGEAPVANNPGGGVSLSSACLENLPYGNGWAAKLPADLPMMAGATLQEAAGRDSPCVLRIASFSAPGDRAAVAGWYATKAKAAGYSVTRAENDGDLVLTGEKFGGAYDIMIHVSKVGRTDVDYIWTKD